MRQLVRMARQDANRLARAEQRRVEWRRACVIWSIDELECRDINGQTVFWLQIQDLGSRYKFGPVVEQARTSAEIAAILRRLFDTYRPPLFLKRDNAGNLNGPELNALLDEYLVISLNSPAYYPPYNGCIEKAQREFKEALARRLAEDPTVASHLLLTTEVISHDLNHKIRPCLKWQTPCSLFGAGRTEMKQYNRTQRKEVQKEILAIAEYMHACIDDGDDRTAQAVWRRAVETWMQSHDFIRIHEPKKCYPLFS